MVDGDRLYVSSVDGTVHAVDAATGDHLWSELVDGEDDFHLAAADGTVYVMSDDLYALEAASGSERWRGSLNDVVGLKPVVADGTVLAHDSDELVAFDTTTGQRHWEWPLEQGSSPLHPISAPAVAAGTLYVTHRAGRVEARDLATGTRRFSSPIDGRSIRAPTVSGQTLYAATMEGDAYALDARNGKRRWRLSGDGWNRQPVVGDDTLYLFDGDVRAYRGTGSGTPPTPSETGDAPADRTSPTVAGSSTRAPPPSSGTTGIETEAPGPTRPFDDGWLDGWHPLLAWLVGVPVLGPLILATLVAATARDDDDTPTEDAEA